MAYRALDSGEIDSLLTKAEIEELVEAFYKLEYVLVGHRLHQLKLR